MTTALYRRYRPDNFADLIGQTQVTDPLRAALKSDRVHHAYLFSGPRGCGKTTSARILARCLNCAEGPTDTPCGKCASCIELAKGGPGSLDVVEIDAASHNGVDDARDLRERAVFAPARDRYKIFILDEAHMVTTQGFNALLKIVEEPPAHVKFIFATTEPEKVIGTIRSRTHHYPFRLVPPAELLSYLDSVLKSEGYSADDGVLPMVVRASGGSVRDALSLLDQLIAGSDTKKIAYERSINLLGFTHDNLMADVIEAFAELDAAKAFTAVDKIIQSGQDARRFLEDLLERIRDLMLVHSLGQDAKAILRGIGPEQFEQLTIQAARFGLGSLTQTAEATAKALSDTSAASNPRLQLELLCARVLAPAAQAKVVMREVPAAEPAASGAKPVMEAKKTEAKPVAAEPVKKAAAGDVTISFFKANWQIILETLSKQSRSAWAVAFTSKVVDYNDEVLTLLFQSQKDVEAFRNAGGAAEVLRSVIRDMTGVSVKYRAKVADVPSKVASAPVIESNDDEFSEEEEHEELKTEPIETTDPRTGEFILREVLGAKPIKGQK
ncbi:MAG: DNA polymerase III subunit gamma/tau [Actinobacteria bacterium]|uniref:DNA-directed DNA polymerase n=1 Tax=freshwater metagenome TaxID=449393 RepID=A0A6J6C5D9_9ZZZZ|nr:DNA polymerase III subunit gamma/tau [Actinomycetota bacterium]